MKGPPRKSPAASREAARTLARDVARIPGPYQEEGRTLLAESPGGVAAARNEPREPPQTFEEARSRGTDAIAEMLLTGIATARASASTAVMCSPIGCFHARRPNASGSSPSEAIVKLNLAVPYSVALIAENVANTAETPTRVKPTCPRDSDAAAESA